MGLVGWALRAVVLSLRGAKRRGNLPTQERTNPYQTLIYTDLRGFLTAGDAAAAPVWAVFLLYRRIGILYGQLNSACYRKGITRRRMCGKTCGSKRGPSCRPGAAFRAVRVAVDGRRRGR